MRTFLSGAFGFHLPLRVVTALSKKYNRVLALGIPELDKVFLGLQGGDFVILVGRLVCTWLSSLLSVRGQLPLKKGGLNSCVVYLDGGNTFDPYAVSAIAREYGLEPKPTLERVMISRAFTAHQLTALIFEKLEETLGEYKSKLVVVSDIIGLFLDRDVPQTEGRDVFLKMTHYLTEVASKRHAVVVASYVPRPDSRRALFLESVLLGRARVVIRVIGSRNGFKFALEGHPNIESFTLDLASDAVTIDMYMEA